MDKWTCRLEDQVMIQDLFCAAKVLDIFSLKFYPFKDCLLVTNDAHLSTCPPVHLSIMHPHIRFLNFRPLYPMPEMINFE